MRSLTGRSHTAAAVAVVAVRQLTTKVKTGSCNVTGRVSHASRGADGAVVLTEHRLVVANARSFDPDVVTIGLEPGLGVQGWQR